MLALLTLTLQMRKYAPIWDQLKKTGRCKIANIPADRVARIVQAVRKEKWRDLGFKYLQAEAGRDMRLDVKVDTELDTIEFYLVDANNTITVESLGG